MDVGTWSAPDPRTSAPEDDFLPSTPLMQSQTRLAPEDPGRSCGPQIYGGFALAAYHKGICMGGARFPLCDSLKFAPGCFHPYLTCCLRMKPDLGTNTAGAAEG